MSTMIERQSAIAAAIEVEKYSKQGTELLQNGHLTSAVKAFKYAYRYAGDLDDEYMERACAFNLGAAYIAMGQGEKGLNVLQSAVPSEDKRDGRSNGDLYFNFGLGYEVTKNVQDAVRYFNKALEEYRLERDNLVMEIETLNKLATLYSTTHNHLLMNIYHQLAEAYAMQENTEKQMHALCEKANAYNSYGDPQKAESAADECLKVSEKCDATADSGNVFNDLGLLYTQLQKYDKALKCFEEALPLAQNSDDKKKEAVIRQNLGAAYNFVGEYQRAISFHKSAADMYARLQNRNSQGQCYANLAYAYSQLKDMVRAKQAFDHALLAAEDTDDNRTTWQVSEGLGSVAFNEGNFDEAIDFFKKALGVLAARESNIIAQNRIVEKLKQALEAQIRDRERPLHHLSKEVINPLKTVQKREPRPNKTPLTDVPAEAVIEQAVAVEAAAVEGGQKERRYIRVSKSGSQKRFSKVARGLSDLMEAYHPPEMSLQGETLKPVKSEEETTESDSESESSETDSEDKDSGMKKSASNVAMRGSVASEDSVDDEETSDESDEEEAVREQMRKLGKGGTDSEEDKDKGDEKTQKSSPSKQQHVGKEEEESSSGSDSSETESSSSSETGDERPPVPSGSIPKTGDVGTYEQPWGRTGSKKKSNYAEIDFETNARIGEKSKYHPNYMATPDEDTDSLRVNMGTRASGEYNKLVEDEDIDDPLYQTIPSRSIRNDLDDDKNFPKFSSLPRGEKERILYEKHRQDQRDRQPPPIPERREKDSKTCVVM